LNTVVDAYQFAIDWCGNSPEQKAAIRACRAALAGDVDAETARGVFVAFARKKDILIEGGTIPPFWEVRGRNMSDVTEAAGNAASFLRQEASLDS
ncbi:DUF982 domain-containing protein, partial [Mesorhizobium sp. M2A.F.Ca.ET.037.01.1.1]|uniref:DUF982 domain-containing protein n=1 Tax=Mesorhizobium sp. M2A.F.Ca.ET.037.01.1.1 TaxID=2496748 RepID=UPI000FD2155D